jgi:N-acetylglucosamine-6-phosphate deacetylase
MTRAPSAGPPPRNTVVTGGLLRDDRIVPGAVVIEDGLIVEVSYGVPITDHTARHYDTPGGLILPGLIDLHIHGSGGHHAYRDRAGVRELGRYLLGQGVTGFLATVPCLPWADMQSACRMLAGACIAGDPPNLLGIHVEGPHLAPRRCGSQTPECLRPPSLADFRALRAAAGPALRMMTIAAELPGAIEVIRACVTEGVVASLGHTDATFEQAQAGFAAGITHVTHLYNAMPAFHHRKPGAVAAALARPAITAELILDGEHLHQGAWLLARASLGRGRIALISDALPCAGTAGPHAGWDGRPLVRSGRRLTLADGTLAGSDISLRQAMLQARAWGAPWAEAVEAASVTPARVLGLADRFAALLPGRRADISVLSQDHQVQMTMVGGQPAYVHGRGPSSLACGPPAAGPER